jgi:hypothetical protein
MRTAVDVVAETIHGRSEAAGKVAPVAVATAEDKGPEAGAPGAPRAGVDGDGAAIHAVAPYEPLSSFQLIVCKYICLVSLSCKC